MIATMSAAIATGPIGRSYVSLRDGPVGRFLASSFFDWLIPGAIVITLIVCAGFVFLGPA